MRTTPNPETGGNILTFLSFLPFGGTRRDNNGDCGDETREVCDNTYFVFLRELGSLGIFIDICDMRRSSTDNLEPANRIYEITNPSESSSLFDLDR